MFNLNKFLAICGLATVSMITAIAQDAPKTPEKQVIERHFEIIGDGGDSYLGIQVSNINSTNLTKFGLKEVVGVAVEKVVDGSPAQNGGLKDNDVIAKFNGESISSVRQLSRLINETAPDHAAKISVLRNGAPVELTATIQKSPHGGTAFGEPMMTRTVTGGGNGENIVREMRIMGDGTNAPGADIRTVIVEGGSMPAVPAMRRMPTGSVMQVVPDRVGPVAGAFITRSGDDTFASAFPRQIGVGVSDLTKQLGEYFGVTDGKGLLVTEVGADSPAAKAGIKAGDVIVEVGEKSVTNIFELMNAISEKKEGAVDFTIFRDKKGQNIKVTPEARRDIETRQIMRTIDDGGKPIGAKTGEKQVNLKVTVNKIL